MRYTQQKRTFRKIFCFSFFVHHFPTDKKIELATDYFNPQTHWLDYPAGWAVYRWFRWPPQCLFSQILVVRCVALLLMYFTAINCRSCKTFLQPRQCDMFRLMRITWVCIYCFFLLSSVVLFCEKPRFNFLFFSFDSASFSLFHTLSPSLSLSPCTVLFIEMDEENKSFMGCESRI